MISIWIIFGCASHKNIVGKQGINGEVRWLEGNLMPTIGDSTYADRAKGKPIEREIYIFEATRLEEVVSTGGTFYSSISTDLVKKVMSGKDGTFRVVLSPGTYSLFVKEEKGFFANRFDGNNYINPVTVQANKFTDVQIQVNYKAYY